MIEMLEELKQFYTKRRAHAKKRLDKVIDEQGDTPDRKSVV